MEDDKRRDASDKLERGAGARPVIDYFDKKIEQSSNKDSNSETSDKASEEGKRRWFALEVWKVEFGGWREYALYRIEIVEGRCVVEVGKLGFGVFKFKLVRIVNQVEMGSTVLKFVNTSFNLDLRGLPCGCEEEWGGVLLMIANGLLVKEKPLIFGMMEPTLPLSSTRCQKPSQSTRCEEYA
ncbi:hypothetical protein Tco_0861710 [Tanacetum coccineum]|uniref:Uncharacterized protein n=1 Tax=Tanacetum coccineum TaxID=301880 RepID=A0ABQ5BLI5_9ASTR